MYSQEVNWLLFEKYHGEKSEDFFADCARLEAGIPLAYLIGHIPFLTASIHLDSLPLIPRPETEFWVEKVINQIYEKEKPVFVLDLCAGSGAIGIAVLKKCRNSIMTFVELDSSHLPTIAKNCRVNEIDPERVTILEGDIFQTNTTLPKFDFILSNPPYIDETLKRVDSSVLINEPHQALFGGKQGFEIIEKIVADAPKYLNPNGELWIEHEPEQENLITTLAPKHSFHITTHKDQFNNLRYSRLVLQ